MGRKVSGTPAHEATAVETARLAPDLDDIVGGIGPKIRELRLGLGLSLQQLASQSSVSAAAIHKLERSDMVPTITTLLKLSAALDRPVSYFIDESSEALDVATLTPADQRPPLDTPVEGLVLEAISGPATRFRVRGSMATIAPGATSVDHAQTRAGEQLLMVLEGTLVVEVQGHVHTVEKGGALHFPTDRPHHWTNPGRTPASVLWVSLSDR